MSESVRVWTVHYTEGGVGKAHMGESVAVIANTAADAIATFIHRLHKPSEWVYSVEYKGSAIQ